VKVNFHLDNSHHIDHRVLLTPSVPTPNPNLNPNRV